MLIEQSSLVMRGIITTIGLEYKHLRTNGIVYYYHLHGWWTLYSLSLDQAVCIQTVVAYSMKADIVDIEMSYCIYVVIKVHVQVKLHTSSTWKQTQLNCHTVIYVCQSAHKS